MAMSESGEGTVLDAAGELLRADGLADVGLMDVVELDGGGLGLVTALRAEHVELEALDAARPAVGARVRRRGRLEVPAGDGLLGRTIDALGRPRDGGGAIDADASAPLFPRAPSVLPASRARRFTLGLLASDLMLAPRAGASLLTVGGAPFLLDTIARHQLAAGRRVILAQPAGPRAVHQPPASLTVTGAGATSAGRWLVPWAAMAIGEALRARGYEVVVLVDGLHFWLRLAARFPHHGAPITQAGRLAARAWAGPDGSVTLVATSAGPTVRARGDCVDLVVDLDRAQRGLLPDLGTKRARPPIDVRGKARLGRLVTLLAQLEELDRRDPFAELGPELTQARRAQAALQPRAGDPVDSVEQLALLLAVLALEALPPSQIPRFVERFLARLRDDHAALLDEVRARRLIDEPDEALLRDAALALEATLG